MCTQTFQQCWLSYEVDEQNSDAPLMGYILQTVAHQVPKEDENGAMRKHKSKSISQDIGFADVSCHPEWLSFCGHFESFYSI